MDKELYEETKKQIKKKTSGTVGNDAPVVPSSNSNEPIANVTGNEVVPPKPKRGRKKSVEDDASVVQPEVAPTPAKRGRRKLNTEKIAE